MYRLDPLGSATCIRFVTRVTGITPSPGFGMTEGSDDGGHRVRSIENRRT